MRLTTPKKIIPSDGPGKTMCARWLEFVVRRDPLLKESIPDLLEEFADRYGWTVPELNQQFLDEEARCRAEDEAKARKRSRGA